jgi:hypothetical protein
VTRPAILRHSHLSVFIQYFCGNFTAGKQWEHAEHVEQVAVFRPQFPGQKKEDFFLCVGILTRNNDVYSLTFSPFVLFLFFSLTFLDRVVVKKAEGGFVQLDPTFQLLVFLIRKFNLIPK